MTEYGVSRELRMPLAQAVEEVVKGLQEHGFGVLTRIDVQKEFKEKLGVDFKRYVILEAYNPASVQEAIGAEEDIGLMLLCNVIVYEKDGKTIVSAIRPTAAMQIVDNPDLKTIAQTIEARLESSIASVE